MIDSMRNLIAGRIDLIPENLSYPLLRWCSGVRENVHACNEVNKLLFYVYKPLALHMLSFKVKRFSKYPKAEKKDDSPTIEIIKEPIKKMFNWSEKELKSNIQIIEVLSRKKDFLNELNSIAAFTEKECKILDISFVKIEEKTKIKKTKPQTAGVFAFV